MRLEGVLELALEGVLVEVLEGGREAALVEAVDGVLVRVLEGVLAGLLVGLLDGVLERGPERGPERGLASQVLLAALWSIGPGRARESPPPATENQRIFTGYNCVGAGRKVATNREKRLIPG
ncbi:MAG: hypothetical protein SGPRY_001825 [Prymnesium sp.]